MDFPARLAESSILTGFAGVLAASYRNRRNRTGFNEGAALQGPSILNPP
jgi:hypothetical protein